MGQIEGQFVIVAGQHSTLRDVAVKRCEAEGAKVVVTEASADAVRKAAEAEGKLDAIVCVLRGGEKWAPFADGTGDSLADMLGQVTAIGDALRAAYPFLKASRGRGVTVCSLHGPTAFAHVVPTVTADMALQGLTRAVGVEWAKDDIQVNCLIPSALDVPEFRKFYDAHKADVDHRIENMAMHRLGDPMEDFGGAMMMLLSDEACFLVGHPVYVDGGQHLVAPVFEPGTQFAQLRK